MSAEISIIVPVYNVKNLLERCVDSILDQSFKDFEVLLIDDGSTDGSSLLCDILSEKDSRITVYHKENGGLSDARNYGLQYAKGDFYVFIDSDDLIHEDFCKTLVTAQKKYNADIVSVDVQEFHFYDEVDLLRSGLDSTAVRWYSGKQILLQYFMPQNKDYIYHGLCMKLYSKRMFNDLKFEKNRLHEDLYITYKLLEKCNLFVKINVPYYYYYRNNTNSITQNYTEKNLIDEHDALLEILKYFDSDNDIKNGLYYFVVNHSLYLLERLVCLPPSKELQKRKNMLKHWVKSNINECISISFFKGRLYIIKLYFTREYVFLKRIKKYFCIWIKNMNKTGLFYSC